MKRTLLVVLSIVMMATTSFVTVSAQAKAKAKTMSMSGVVKSVSADSLAITAAGKDVTFAVDSSTKFVGKGLSTKSASGPIKVTDATKAGDQVKVSYHSMNGTMHAASVTIISKSMK
jgi:Domain of unknown function (DUF5666)